MMKVSDPIIFGHAVRAYFADVFERHGDELRSAGVNPNDGLGALLKAIESLPADQRTAIEAAIDATYERGPGLAMVDSDRGHHQPARPQRRDHRRVDAGRDPVLGSDVERGRRACRTPSS